MKAYLDIVNKILATGEIKDSRTGVSTIAIAGAIFEHDMAKGFPLLTTKKMSYKSIFTELEFFIQGFTDKKWLQDRKCTIWNEWCSPDIVPYGTDEETKAKMAAERDLGPIYGWQWRHFGAEYVGYDFDYKDKGVDQLKLMIDKLKSNPSDRRMIVSAWNPRDIKSMALPACHYGFQVTVINGKLNLLWNQRSADTMLGLPFNIASYALLLHLLALESGLKPGKLIGLLADTHIYEDQLDGAREQVSRDPEKFDLPTIKIVNFTNIFDWQAKDVELIDYKSYPKIEFPLAV